MRGALFPPPERIYCQADPALGVKADTTQCRLDGLPVPHDWRRVETEDAYRCGRCLKTYVGGPVVEMKT